VFKGLAFNGRQNPRVTELIFDDLQRAYDVEEQMASFKQPVLIIHGDHDIVNPDVARQVHRVLKNSKLVILEDCGHYGWLDRPDKYYQSIYDFLQQQ